MHFTPAGAVFCYSPKPPAGRPGCVIESTRFQHETSAGYLLQYSNLVREGRKKELAKAIGLPAQGIKDTEILTDEVGESHLSMTAGDGRLLPLHDLRGGAVRLVRLLLSFSAFRNGILLSDRLKNGMHQLRAPGESGTQRAAG